MSLGVEDYGMMPQDKFEIIEEKADEEFHFHIEFAEKYITVYVEGSGDIYPRVYQNGEELHCGHNRFWDKE